MLLAKSSQMFHWYHKESIANLATVTMPVGGPGVGYFSGQGPDWAPVLDLPFFSLDVYTNQAVVIELQVAVGGQVSTFTTVTCAPALQHTSVYDMVPPFNKAGHLVLTGDFLRIRVSNNTGALATPFVFFARAWR